MWGRGGTAIRQRFFKPTARMMLSVQATVFIWIITRVRTHHCVEDENNNQHKGGGMADAHIESGRQNGCLKNCKVKSLANCKARNTRKHGQHAKATTDLGTFVPEYDKNPKLPKQQKERRRREVSSVAPNIKSYTILQLQVVSAASTLECQRVLSWWKHTGA